MQIFVAGMNVIKGYNKRYTPIYELKETDLVRNIKQIILNMFNIESKHFYLTYKGKILNENMTLNYYQIESDSNLYFHCKF